MIASYGLIKKPLMSLKFFKMLLSFFRSSRTSSATLLKSWAFSVCAKSKSLPSWSRTLAFAAFGLAIWRQKSPKPNSVNRFLTTWSATSFSATKRIVFPWYIKFTIMLAIVWLFPVPGGPSRMKLSPFKASLIAKICDESTGKGVAISTGLIFSSISFKVKASSFGWNLEAPLTREATTSFSKSFSLRVLMSVHMT